MGQELCTLKESQVYSGGYKVFKYEYKWIIKEFTTLATRNSVGAHTTSPDLILKIDDKTYSFNLILYTNGYNDRVQGFISVYLKKNFSDEILVQFTCAVLNCHNQEFTKKSIQKLMSLESYIGWIEYFPRYFLMLDRTNLLCGHLTLKCTFEIYENKALKDIKTGNSELPHPCKNKSLLKMSEDMKQLFLNKDFSDVTFKVDGQDFPAHKAILSARSAVFKSMLKSQWEGNSKVIQINDIRAEAIKEMLHFIYSGEIECIDVEMAQELYHISDKYELDDLKNICSKILERDLNVNNAIDILLLGYKHSDNELKHAAIKFIAENAPEIQEQKEWMYLLKNYPELANMVFKHLSKNS